MLRKDGCRISLEGHSFGLSTLFYLCILSIDALCVLPLPTLRLGVTIALLIPKVVRHSYLRRESTCTYCIDSAKNYQLVGS